MDKCIFCNIIAGKIPAEFIYMDDDVAVFKDVNPKAPVHLLAVPVKHIPSITEAEGTDELILGKILIAIKEAVKKTGIAGTGFKIISNNGKAVGQIVFHLHFHVIGGWKDQQYFDI